MNSFSCTNTPYRVATTLSCSSGRDVKISFPAFVIVQSGSSKFYNRKFRGKDMELIEPIETEGRTTTVYWIEKCLPYKTLIKTGV